MAGYGKDDVRKDTTGRGKKRSVKVTGYGEDKVKKVYKKGKLVKSKTGTLISRAQDAATEFQKKRAMRKDAATKANQAATRANETKAEEIKSRKMKKKARKM